LKRREGRPRGGGETERRRREGSKESKEDERGSFFGLDLFFFFYLNLYTRTRGTLGSRGGWEVKDNQSKKEGKREREDGREKGRSEPRLSLCQLSLPFALRAVPFVILTPRGSRSFF